MKSKKFFVTDDYGRARNKARLAEDMSDLNSGNESATQKENEFRKFYPVLLRMNQVTVYYPHYQNFHKL